MFNYDSFEKDFDDSKKRFNVIFSIVTTIIVLFWIAVIGVIIYGCVTVSQHGMKSTIERFWNGPRN